MTESTILNLVAYMSQNGTFVTPSYYEDLLPTSQAKWTPVYAAGADAGKTGRVIAVRPMDCTSVVKWDPDQNGHIPKCFDVGASVFASASQA